MALPSGHGERVSTIRADDLGRHMRAEAYSFPCQHEDFAVPGVRDHFMTEFQTSRRPNDIERKMDGWQRRRHGLLTLRP